MNQTDTPNPLNGRTENVESTILHLARAMKTPTIGKVFEQLAVTARDQGWSHEQYLAAVLDRQVCDREANATALRINGAHFPVVKTLEDFNVCQGTAGSPCGRTVGVPVGGHVISLSTDT